MITETGLTKVGEDKDLSTKNLKEKDKTELDTGEKWARGLFDTANLQQGLIGQGIPADSLQKRAINGNLIVNGSIAAQKLIISNGNFISSITFSTSAYNVADWTSGTIQFANGFSLAVNSGTTGALSGTTTRYIYFNKTSTLQVTTDISIIKGENVLLCIVAPQSSDSSGAILSPVNAKGTTISGDSVTTGTVSSPNGQTYFDLNNGRIVINDGVNDRVIIGQF